MAGKPEGYVEVAERIESFYEKYPEGSLQGSWQPVEINGDTLLIYEARAYRTPQDERPAIGTASEPYPGKTNFTRDSELMNAETSAWGRAIAALGFEVRRGIASANEVRNRQGSESDNGAFVSPSTPQLEFLERLLKDNGVPPEDTETIKGYATANLTGGKEGSMSKAIDRLKDSPDETTTRLVKAALEWQAKQTDIPGDAEDLPEDRPETQKV